MFRKKAGKDQKVRQRGGIRRKILMLVWLSVLPMTVVTIYAIFMIDAFYQQYDQSVKNITMINDYNVSFEKNMNGSMYYIIVETYDWNTLKNEDSRQNPYVQIEDFRKKLDELRSTTEDVSTRSDLDAIGKMLSSLKLRVDDIIVNVEKGDRYDESMEMLKSNINTLTGLIQKDIVDYISLEVANMERVQASISRQISWAMTVLAALVFVLLAVTLITSNRISRKITDPIRRMCEKTEQFASGDFSVRIDARSGDELDRLAESFNSMVTEIGKLVEDIRIEQKNAKDAELRILQAQINPHFLYNTLDAIMWLVEAGEKEQAVSMVSSLSDFFRTTLSKGRDWITVAEERSHIDSYLKIQKFRYADILDYEIDIPASIENYFVMKLTLQPIVENALYHGIKNKRGKGRIVVRGREDGEDLLFTVEDDGIGMMPAELDRMRKLISGEIATDHSKHGFGIANVEQRIRLRYGEGYGVTAESEYGVGSRVMVRIPKVEHPPA